MKDYIIDNSRPTSPDYPKFTPAKFRNTNLIVQKDQHIVNSDGEIMIVTSPNKKTYPNSFLKSINQGYIRARYLGNKDDSLEFANQIRLATEKEVKLSKKYKREGFMTTTSGQGVLL